MKTRHPSTCTQRALLEKTETSVGVSAAVMNIMSTAPGEEREVCPTRRRGGQAEAMKGCLLIAPHSWLSLLPYTTTKITSPGVPLPTVSWALPHPSSIKKTHHRLCWQVNLVRTLSPLRVHPPKWHYLVSSWHETSQHNKQNYTLKCHEKTNKQKAIKEIRWGREGGDKAVSPTLRTCLH